MPHYKTALLTSGTIYGLGKFVIVTGLHSTFICHEHPGFENISFLLEISELHEELAINPSRAFSRVLSCSDRTLKMSLFENKSKPQF